MAEVSPTASVELAVIEFPVVSSPGRSRPAGRPHRAQHRDILDLVFVTRTSTARWKALS